MVESQKTVLVVDQDLGRAENLKALIEFMDTPSVVTAMPHDWQNQLGMRRLEAMFVGPDLSDDVVGALLKELEQFDPNIPVVMVQART